MKLKRKLCSCAAMENMNWFLLCLLISLAQMEVEATISGKFCETKAGFNLAAVTPMWEEEVSAIGCFSKNTSLRDQEVHVVHLKEVDGWPTPKVVTVHIRPFDERAIYKKSFVLLLHSEFTVSWKLLAERLNNSIYHRIIVTQGSQVIENRDFQITIQRRHSGDIKHLLVWLNKRYKSVTSYAKIRAANNIHLQLGFKNDGTPSVCDVTNRKHVPNIAAYIQDNVGQRQGCVARRPMGQSKRLVHIINIHETRRDSDTGRDNVVGKVTVHLNSRNQHNQARDVALVLKSSQTVEWILINDGIRGRLDIVTEGKVVMPRNVVSSEISVRTEVLPNVTKELMSYSVDWFGQSFTYTEVWRANSIRVLVDASDEEGLPPKEIETIYPRVEETGHRPRAIGNKDIKSRLRHGHTTRVGSETHMLVKSKKPLKAHEIIRMPSVMLIDVMTVECLPQQMRVSFPRISMEQLGLQPETISLSESHCSVTTNETHYILDSPFEFCGTKKIVDEEKIVYKNEVHFHFQVQKLGSLFSGWTEVESSTLPIDDEDSGGAGSGNSALPTADSSEANTMEFKCEYIHHGSSRQPEIPESPHSTRDTATLTAARGLFSLEMSRDPSFIRHVTNDEYPFIALEHDILYVETRLDAGTELQVVTEDCWLSENQDPKAAPVSKLISNGCPTGPSVRFESSGDLFSNRFSFQLGSEYITHSKLYLQCKLGICASDKAQSTKWRLKMCIDPKDFCMIDSLRSYLELPRSTHHDVFIRGPFQVKKRSPSTRNSLSSIPFRQQGKLDLEVVDGGTIDFPCTIPAQPPVIVLGLSTESVIGIAFASFVIGVGLSAVLWCIYMKTDPLRAIHRHPTHHHSGFDLSAHSGSSTPSSQSPMTA